MMVNFLSSEQRNTLFELILQKSFIRSEKPILLSSGNYSDHYFDLKQVTGDPQGINEIAKVLFSQIEKIGGIQSVGGLESGSIAISTAISMISSKSQSPISSFYVRKIPKKHGLSKWIEGKATEPAVIVDDVVTTGKSALDALRVLKDEKINVQYLFAIVYRGTPEAKEKLEREHNIKLINLFDESEFLEKDNKNFIEA